MTAAAERTHHGRPPPDISVIIPTIARPTLRAAVASVVSNSSLRTEVVVVLDRPEALETTRRLLDGLDHRLLIGPARGPSAARNHGLVHATGEAVAFLDDDDQWLPGNGAPQLDALQAAPDPTRAVAVTSSEFVRADGTVLRRPPRRFDPTRETFVSHLVARRSLRYGAVHFNTPSVVLALDLARRVGWDERLARHEDWDYLARLMAEPALTVTYVPGPLVRVQQGSEQSLSRDSSWRHGEAWLAKHDADLSGRARADFVLVHVLGPALRARSGAGVRVACSLLRPPDLRRAFRALPHGAAVVRTLAAALGR